MVAVLREEGGHADGTVICSVVCEFGERKKLRPVILQVVAVYVKMLFDRLIEAFSLSIGLGMKGSGQVWGDVEQSKRFSPPGSDVLISSI